ncbi:uncharacterized protein LOC110976371 [Acanthaster planci]|uniref:Uncharacterized protein LOC110976371 n=1 Tax=Acanthaster planci TaxID=133434 RepID=A0A8B7XZ09_ACAPL|nr:uncharacterized protein LOC110976371 [Acanthaster planci]
MCSSVIMFTLLAVTVLTVIMVGTSYAAVTCMDANGKPVDWFIVYKLPRDSNSQILQVRDGCGQMYMDANNPVLKLSSAWISDTDHAIAYTLKQIYQNHASQDVAYLLYNDELPNSKAKTSTHGHTKGDLAFDATSGFWLVHSTPRFPNNSSMTYSWPESAQIYGQAFLCVTYGYDQFEEIGQQLMYNYPWIYDFNLPSELVSHTPSISRVAHKEHVTSPPWNRTATLTSRAGQRFISFAKASNFGKDLYAGWLAPYFNSTLYVETWQNGPGNMNSSCVKGRNVNNIKNLNLAGGEAFKNSKDHSKWAVTTKSGLAWTCIGDINRQCHQEFRGGGTVCFQNAAVNKVFHDSVTGIQQCPQPQTFCCLPNTHRDFLEMEGGIRTYSGSWLIKFRTILEFGKGLNYNTDRTTARKWKADKVFMMHSSVMVFILLAVTVFTTILVGTSEAEVTCLDANGKPVDWFIVYKLPRDSQGQTSQVREGYAQMYMDVNNPILKLSDVWLNATDQAIAYTLQQIYQNYGSQKLAYLMYNDQPPDEVPKWRCGHSKGDLAFDGTSGFWLVHSIPKFPLPSSEYYNWPSNARRFGQQLLCVTFRYNQFEKVGQQLKYNNPWVYDANLPSGLVNHTPSIRDVVNKQHITSPPWNRALDLTSKAGRKFVSFAKAGKFGKDLYADWLAPYFNSDLYVETWQRLGKNMNSSCVGGLDVYNVKHLNLADGEDFGNCQDHSKWAVTIKPGLEWTCIGDINRQFTQERRGGGTLCLQNAAVSLPLMASVDSGWYTAYLNFLYPHLKATIGQTMPNVMARHCCVLPSNTTSLKK